MDRSSLFPPNVSWVFRQAQEPEEAALIEQLTPEERLLVPADAASKRIAEFGLGRKCGREALRLLGAWPGGASPPSILRRDRMPVWPAGIVGSIAHSHGAAIATVAYASEMHGRKCMLAKALATEIPLKRPGNVPENLCGASIVADSMQSKAKV
jgi:4'-phosphopantetheinyl transferase EntD